MMILQRALDVELLERQQQVVGDVVECLVGDVSEACAVVSGWPSHDGSPAPST